MATFITKNSQTASAVPSAASLEVGELAVNTADGKLYTEHTGGVVKEIIPSTVVDGGITEAKIATNAVTSDKFNASAVTTAKIADANVTGAKLENSGVTAGSYGNGSTIPAITVDAKGRVTSVTTNAVASSAPTTAQVLTATAGATAGGVGTYTLAKTNTHVGTLALGSTRAGSGLEYVAANYSIAQGDAISGGNPPGTWRLMTYLRDASNSTFLTPLWLRIS